MGSSPHVRGALRRRPWTEDHPRMCGEHRSGFNALFFLTGSSPHVRGARKDSPLRRCHSGIIPACAGSTLTLAVSRSRARDHPRMCGEHNKTAQTDLSKQGSSPHVRGAHFENSIIPRKRKDNWLFFIQFRFENFLAFRYLLALLHPFLGVPTKDPSFASLGRLINCNPSQSTGDQSAPYTLKAICCSFLAE